MKENEIPASSTALKLVEAALQGGTIKLRGVTRTNAKAIEEDAETDALYLATLLKKLTTTLQLPE